MKEHEAYLDVILRERPYRAVDRIFSQHRTQQISQIYNFLQSKLRTNTNELRQSLYRKYENLINCSELLENLNHYSTNIQHFSVKIQQIINKDYQQHDIQYQPLRGIAQIQQLLLKKNFLQAMQYCNKKQQLNEENYFMTYMPVQVIQKMENCLANQCLTNQNISEYLMVLKLFLENKSYGQLAGIVKGMKQQSLLNIITCNTKQQISTSQQLLNKILLNSLFQFKMKTLSHCQSNTKIFEFFNSLLKIAQDQLVNTTVLGQIFMNYADFVHKKLALIFIQDRGSILNFQHEMYESLMSSEEFKHILSQLEKYLGFSQTNIIIKQFENLWADYLVSIIDFFEEKINPLKYVQNILSKQQINKDFPSQYQEFIQDRIQQESIKIRNNYRSYLQSYKSIIGDLYKKGNQQQINQMIIGKINNINQKINQKINFLAVSKQLVKIYIIIKWLCQDYNAVNQLQMSIDINKKLECYIQPTKILPVFVNDEQDLEYIMIQFDIFFLEMTSINSSKADIEQLRALILVLLQCWKQKYKKHQHKIQSHILYLTKKKQILSLYRCLIPGIAENIFYLDLQSDEKLIDLSLFGKYIQKVQQNIQKPQQSQDVDFDIGEMQAPEDTIKVSMKSFGNIISGLKGFMPKKK